MTLFGYRRWTTSYRVKSALHLKGLKFQTMTGDLSAGEQRTVDYLNVTPAAGVPASELPSGQILAQSMAIPDHLEDRPSLADVCLVRRCRMLIAGPVTSAIFHAWQRSRNAARPCLPLMLSTPKINPIPSE
ncbi:MAG: hypothetical protein MK160_09545 [Rhodobacteraceae bacterium]|nr:hypothetical protein [Paracoccaceae bacterium]